MQISNIPIEAIVVGERQRKDLGDIESLQFSIQQFDLLVPIIVKKRQDGRYDLIAGERRLIAFKRLEKQEIPAILREDLDDLSRMELECEENLNRKNLNWLEEARILSKLHKLKEEKYGNALPAKFGRGNVWSQRDTAKSLGIAEGKVSEDMRLVEAYEEHPELEKLRTRREALRQLRRFSDGLVMEETKVTLRMKECFLHSEFFEGMKMIENLSVDLLITDLTGNIYENVISELFRVLKMQGHAFVFFPLPSYNTLIDSFKRQKINFRDRPHVWHVKGEDKYQTFLWFSRALAKPPEYIHEHLSFRKDKDTLHTLAKPYQLLYILVNNSTKKGDFVLDPLCYDIMLTKVCLDLGRNVRCFCPNQILHEQEFLELEG